MQRSRESLLKETNAPSYLQMRRSRYCLNGMNDVVEISPLRGYVTQGLNSFLQRLGREVAGMRSL